MSEEPVTPSTPTSTAAEQQAQLEASLHEKQSVLARMRQMVTDTEAEVLRLEGGIIATRERVAHEAASASLHAELAAALEQARAELDALRHQSPTDTPASTTDQPTDRTTDGDIAEGEASA